LSSKSYSYLIFDSPLCAALLGGLFPYDMHYG